MYRYSLGLSCDIKESKSHTTLDVDTQHMNHSRYGPLPVWSSRYGSTPTHYGPPGLVIMVHLRGS